MEKSDGTRVTVRVHIDPLLDRSGTIIGVVNFFYAVTERKTKEIDSKVHASNWNLLCNNEPHL